MNRLAGWWNRLRSFVRRREERDLDEELAFHLEKLTEENVAAGMPPEEAMRQARIAFGGVEIEAGVPREQTRILARGAGTGRAVCAARVSKKSGLHPDGCADAHAGDWSYGGSIQCGGQDSISPFAVCTWDRLVSVGLVQSLETQEFMLGGFYYDWRRNQTPFEAMTSETAATRECDVTEGSPAQLSCPTVEVNFLPTLGITPVAGRNFLPEEGRPGAPRVVLISYGLWLRHYNLDPGILNKTIEIDGKRERVVGVLPKDFEMPRLQAADVVFPMTMDEVADRKSNEGIGAPKRVFARLKPGVSAEQAREQLEPLFKQTQNWIPAQIRSNFHLMVRSLRDKQMQDVHLTAWVLLGTVLAVLFIACANVASLLMARGAARQRELAVRSALGASRGRLVRQALTEAALLSLAGAVTGCVLAQGLLRIFVAMAPASVPYISRVQLDLRIVGFVVVLSFCCGALFGLVPALQRPREEMLTGRMLGSISHAAIRQWLVVGQIAASMVLLTAAMLMLRSFWGLEHQQLGMREDNTVTASVTLGSHNYSSGESKMAFFQQLATRLRFGPGVEVVSVSDSLPPVGGGSRFYYDIRVNGRSRQEEGGGPVVTARWVSPDYFHALDIPIVQGVGFRNDDMSSNDLVVVLSQRLAEMLFPAGDAMGKLVSFDHVDPPTHPPLYKVSGIAANVKNGGLSGEQTPEYYLLRRNRAEDWVGRGVWGQTSVIVVRSSLAPEETAKWIRSQVAAMDPTLPVDIATLRQRVSKLADQPRFQASLVGFFAAIGLLLAVIGLYSVIAFLVAQRTQEIGVRMALGAERGDILRLVMRRSLRLISAGVVAGLVAALAASKVLTSMLFGVGPRDPMTYGLVTLSLVAVALAATLLPARAASRVDPAVALRSE